MRLLLDTHIALWLAFDADRLSRSALSILSHPEADLIVSAASIWEIAIKHASGRGGPNAMPVSGAAALAEFRRGELELLPILPEHVVAVDGLPPHHGDPFDRLLVAQALTEPMRLVTADRQLAAYGPLIDLV